MRATELNNSAAELSVRTCSPMFSRFLRVVYSSPELPFSGFRRHGLWEQQRESLVPTGRVLDDFSKVDKTLQLVTNTHTFLQRWMFSLTVSEQLQNCSRKGLLSSPVTAPKLSNKFHLTNHCCILSNSTHTTNVLCL